VRALLAFMWTHPGKKNHLHLGMEVRSAGEWEVWGILNGICSSSIPIRAC